MKTQPQLIIKPTKADKVIAFLSYLLLAIMWLLTLYALTILPATIPIHFNATGIANNYGSKNNLVALPIIATCIFMLLSFLNKHPHWFNYPVKVNDSNALQLYTTATKTLRFIQLSITLVFLLIIMFTIQAAVNQTHQLPIWLLPVVLTLILLPVTIALVKMMRKGNRG